MSLSKRERTDRRREHESFLTGARVVLQRKLWVFSSSTNSPGATISTLARTTTPKAKGRPAGTGLASQKERKRHLMPKPMPSRRSDTVVDDEKI